MPLEQRVIQPIGASRHCVPMDASGNLAINIPNELECVTNGTLANIIRQLSSLSFYADDLFGTILLSAKGLIMRANSLQQRIDRLSVKVVSLDSSVEEVMLQDIHLRKAFHSNTVFDQQAMATNTQPRSIAEVYGRCDPPPPLNKLNVYRDDGKDGLKFYTDPNYFFDLWRSEMLEQTEKVLHERKKNSGHKQSNSDAKKRRVRAPTNTRERIRQMAANHEFIVENGGQHVQTQMHAPQQQQLHHPSLQRPNSLVHSSHVSSSDASQHALAVMQMNEYNNSLQQHFNNTNSNISMTTTATQPQQQTLHSTPTRRPTVVTSRPSQPPPAPPSSLPSSGPSTPLRSEVDSIAKRTRDCLPPPPPPPSIILQETTQQCVDALLPPMGRQESPMTASHVTNNTEMNNEREQPPPPPPPPPSASHTDNSMIMTMSGNGHHLPSYNHHAHGQQQPPTIGHHHPHQHPHQAQPLPTLSDLQSIQLKKTSIPTVKPTDARSDLLQAIREGIKLKRVEDCKQREVEKTTPLHDVASILARRVAIELSDSEGGNEDDCDDDSDAWDDESEC